MLMTPDELAQVPLEERAGSQTHWHPCNHHSCQDLAHRQLNMLRRDVTPWGKALEQENESLGRTLEQAAAKNDELLRSLVELKKIDLIGPLTAEEWMEFRLRGEADDDHDLLRCCANTSAIRDHLFDLMRRYAEDPLLGRNRFVQAWTAFNEHGYEDWSDRARELMDRLHAYYGCHGCTGHGERG
jgi:hypothetical protein